MQYTVIFHGCKNDDFSDDCFKYFSYFCSTSTHNLYFRTKLRKNVLLHYGREIVKLADCTMDLVTNLAISYIVFGTGDVTAAVFCHGCHGFSVWGFRDVIAFSRHGRHGFSVRIFCDVIAFNRHGFSSCCDKFVADFATRLNWVVFLYLYSCWFVPCPPGYSQSPLVLGVFYLLSVSCLQRL